MQDSRLFRIDRTCPAVFKGTAHECREMCHQLDTSYDLLAEGYSSSDILIVAQFNDEHIIVHPDLTKNRSFNTTTNRYEVNGVSDQEVTLHATALPKSDADRRRFGVPLRPSPKVK